MMGPEPSSRVTKQLVAPVIFTPAESTAAWAAGESSSANRGSSVSFTFRIRPRKGSRIAPVSGGSNPASTTVSHLSRCSRSAPTARIASPSRLLDEVVNLF